VCEVAAERGQPVRVDVGVDMVPTVLRGQGRWNGGTGQDEAIRERSSDEGGGVRRGGRPVTE
jgi:hypothetical protein